MCIIVCNIDYVADAKIFRRNDSFDWSSIIMFDFYPIELRGFVNEELFSECNSICVTLSIASIAFIIIPFITNLIQLHKEFSKWLVDPILAHTEERMYNRTIFTRIAGNIIKLSKISYYNYSQ